MIRALTPALIVVASCSVAQAAQRPSLRLPLLLRPTSPRAHRQARSLANLCLVSPFSSAPPFSSLFVSSQPSAVVQAVSLSISSGLHNHSLPPPRRCLSTPATASSSPFSLGDELVFRLVLTALEKYSQPEGNHVLNS